MQQSANVRILGIPVEARFYIDSADRSVGIMSDSIEDVTFHNVKNGSALNWLSDKLDKQGDAAWEKAYETIMAQFEKDCAASYPDDY